MTVAENDKYCFNNSFYLSLNTLKLINFVNIDGKEEIALYNRKTLTGKKTVSENDKYCFNESFYLALYTLKLINFVNIDGKEEIALYNRITLTGKKKLQKMTNTVLITHFTYH